MTITTAEAERIGVMAARLQAGSPTQVAASARTLIDALGEHGLRIGDLLADVLRPRVGSMGTSTASHARQARALLGAPWRFSAYDLQFLFDMTNVDIMSPGQAAKFDRLVRRLAAPAVR